MEKETKKKGRERETENRDIIRKVQRKKGI